MSRDPDAHPRPQKRARREADPDPPIIAAAAAVDPDAAPEEEDAPKPFKINAVDWSQFEQDPDDPIINPSLCVHCYYAKCEAQAAETGNHRWEAMNKYEDENRNKVHPFIYARNVQKIYNEGVRHHLTDDDGEPLVDDPGPWPAQQIWEHRIYHVVDGQAALVENARGVQAIMRATLDCTMYIDSKKNLSVDKAMGKLYSDLEKAARPLFEKLAARKK